MITFKQMEALIWICELGSFELAAKKIYISQSSISKRIHELETSLGIEIFDRCNRRAILTEKGRELLLYSKEMLEKRNDMIERVSSKKMITRRLRLGITDLTAMTWLPTLIKRIKQTYPKVQIETTVEVTKILFENVLNDKLDIIIAPEIYSDVRLVVLPLKNVENAWICSTELINNDDFVSFEDINHRQLPFFVQGTMSGTGIIYERYFAANKILFNENITCANIMAQVGLTISGIGITYLPKKPLKNLIYHNKLRILESLPALPPIMYHAIYRSDRNSELVAEVGSLCQQECNFDRFIIDTI